MKNEMSIENIRKWHGEKRGEKRKCG
jgi:hypothetical protein